MGFLRTIVMSWILLGIEFDFVISLWKPLHMHMHRL
jgi:hypothetical protein